MIWLNAVLGVLGIGGDYLKAKAALKQTKVESEARVIEGAANHIADWETIHAKGSQTSWKDEFWTVLLAIPVVLAFSHFGEFDGPAIAKMGFAALEELPEWYQYTLVTVILASFGIRNKEAVAGIFKRKA
jgi:hypothetical protein